MSGKRNAQLQMQKRNSAYGLALPGPEQTYIDGINTAHQANRNLNTALIELNYVIAYITGLAVNGRGETLTEQISIEIVGILGEKLAEVDTSISKFNQEFRRGLLKYGMDYEDENIDLSRAWEIYEAVKRFVDGRDPDAATLRQLAKKDPLN